MTSVRSYSLFSTPFLLIAALMLSGCANNSDNTVDRFNNVLELSRGQTISAEHLQSTSFASAMVSINDSNPVLMVLVFIDQNPNSYAPRLTWIAQDKATIITENGRIVKTTGFLFDNVERLVEYSPSSSHVTSSLPAPDTSWQAMYDWSPGYRFGFTASVSSISMGEDLVESVLWQQPAQRIQETVHFNGLDSHITNDFWVVPETALHKSYVVKSTQYLGPNMAKIDMLMVKPYVMTVTPEGIN
ncbi:YjbF family lipoprotein [Marinomonas algarum]|uniref:YjbF family lipoprotein n=1 Tax=Marinomonas algarum TaxID=2883105 RepID=A0A9X1LEP1_9GAMM|nr:YjbF family lipoprotein [Marinomonas algarum]MCB5161530.1 YjbF family lipoprotein [Marinomonas algarum]